MDKLAAARETFRRAARQPLSPELDLDAIDFADLDPLALRAAVCYYRLAADETPETDGDRRLAATIRRLEAEERFATLAGRRFNLHDDFVGLPDVPAG